MERMYDRDFDDFLKVISLNDGQYNTEKIRSAYAVAQEAHEGQFRDSGEPYISHPVAVARILAGLGMDSDALVAALLHDVVEDTAVTLEDVSKQFGADIAALVDGVTKLRKLPFSSKEEQQAENIRKMLMAISQDVRVIIIKLADRLHNMRTIGVRPAQKQRDTALETMDIYAPIAHRLGIHAIKEELEDICLRYLDPFSYEEIESQMALEREERQQFLERIKAKIVERLSAKYDDVFVEGRVKGVFGIYRKMFVQGRSFDEIYDIYAIRVIVNTIDECYHIFGEIHDMFRPIPNRFKDYISTPKANQYQSLHTTVFDKEAIPFEVQIRTWDMHHTAEFGIAAHWKYKEGIEETRGTLDDKINWVRQLLETQKETVDTQEILGSIKSDLSTDEIFIFTPKGDIITLPTGSTVVDFAFAIHSQIGHKMVGAKVDGRMVSLDTQLQTGNIVSILTTNAPDHGPSRDWLNFVRTASARNKIRSWFKRERREENIIQGQAELEKEMRRNNIMLGEAEMKDFLLKFAKSQKLNDTREFLAAIGYGGILISKIMPRLKEMYQRQYKTVGEEEIKKQLVRSSAPKQRKASSGVIVEGLDGCLVKYAKCCNPLPGDSIVGYISRGYGVSIHKKDCINAKDAVNDPNQRERWVQCEWAQTVASELYKSTVDIYGKYRDGLLMDVSIALNNMHVPVYALIAKEQPDDQTSIQITFGITSLDQFRHVSSTLGKISGISQVERTVQ